ncbi:MAG TPA: hypothetical protein VEQ65_03650 [Opitutus sp.]|nr:hypothetical protein [Opitutus sp.]
MIQHLTAVHESLVVWDASLRNPNSADRAGSTENSASLLALISETRAGVERRLSELGAPVLAPMRARAAAAAPDGRQEEDAATSPGRSDGLCLRACRACGHLVGAAFREAQAVADSASARTLYGHLRAFEKQLWMLDPLQAR